MSLHNPSITLQNVDSETRLNRRQFHILLCDVENIVLADKFADLLRIAYKENKTIERKDYVGFLRELRFEVQRKKLLPNNINN